MSAHAHGAREPLPTPEASTEPRRSITARSARWSDLPARALTAAIAIPCVLAIAAGPWPWAWVLLVGLAIAVAAWECTTLVAGLGGLFAAASVGLTIAHLALLRVDAGVAWVLLALGVAWGSDVAAYVVGKAVGGPRLAPRLSPRKTVAGALGGLIASVGAGFVFLLAGHEGLDPTRVMAVAIVAGILSQVGDLAESFLKRRAGAKDSGRMVPGHGGMLDCVDGLCLAGPWLYYARTLVVG